ncbi:MAG TPA: hypothetical protein VMW62_01785 [Chloroflexota bacterium]|nr:hypothetical protein [Chloroflexota bacterium]
MKVVETLADFPKKVALRGLQLEAYELLQVRDAQKPVIKVSPDGQNVAAIKRAFAAAAKILGGSVETRNGDDGTILVRWSSSPRTRGRRSTGVQTAKLQHSREAIDLEVKRLHGLKGGSGSVDSLSADSKRKLEISAKRNLSRKG